MVIGILILSAVLLVKAYRVPEPAPGDPVPVETSSALSAR
jgi:hypothetical protein